MKTNNTSGFAARFLYLFRRKKSCRGNCLTCAYYKDCCGDLATPVTMSRKRLIYKKT